MKRGRSKKSQDDSNWVLLRLFEFLDPLSKTSTTRISETIARLIPTLCNDAPEKAIAVQQSDDGEGDAE